MPYSSARRRPRFHAVVQRVVCKDAAHRVGECIDYAHGKQHAEATIAENLARAGRAIACDHGLAERERFEQHHRHAFVARAEYLHARERDQCVRIVSISREMHARCDAQFARQSFQFAAKRAVADDHQMLRNAAVANEFGVGAQQRAMVLLNLVEPCDRHDVRRVAEWRYSGPAVFRDALDVDCVRQDEQALQAIAEHGTRFADHMLVERGDAVVACELRREPALLARTIGETRKKLK